MKNRSARRLSPPDPKDEMAGVPEVAWAVVATIAMLVLAVL